MTLFLLMLMYYILGAFFLESSAPGEVSKWFKLHPVKTTVAYVVILNIWILVALVKVFKRLYKKGN